MPAIVKPCGGERKQGEKAGMRTGQKWLVGVAVLGGLFLTLLYLLPRDEELAAQAAEKLQSRLGVPLQLGSVHWRLLPEPVVVIENAVTGQTPAISVKKITIYPNLGALIDGRLEIRSVELDGAVVPQLALRALDRERSSPARQDATETPLERLVFRDLRWISRHGIAVMYDGEVDFDSYWRPRQVTLQRPDFKPDTALNLTRHGQEDRWRVSIQLGGGTIDGEVQLQTGDKGRMQLSGNLQSKGVELASALAAFNRQSVIAGVASGDIALSASGSTVGELARSLHTHTSFSMGQATLLRFDLDKAIRSAGSDFSGQTPLDAVTGQLDTQNTPQGMVVNYSNLRAGSGAFSASGQAQVANRQLDAEFSIDLVSGLLGLPLQVSGPLGDVKVSVSKAAMAGAALGTGVLPGVGTAIGARLGATLGNLFNADADSAAEKPAISHGK